jgi:hypothetical protein
MCSASALPQLTHSVGRSVKLPLAFASMIMPGFSLLEIHDQDFNFLLDMYVLAFASKIVLLVTSWHVPHRKHCSSVAVQLLLSGQCRKQYSSVVVCGPLPSNSRCTVAYLGSQPSNGFICHNIVQSSGIVQRAACSLLRSGFLLGFTFRA